MTTPDHDPQSDSARLARHRALHSPVHPDVAAAAKAAQRQNLIDQGWTPPRKPGFQPQVPTMAYLHPTADGCVTTDPTAYQAPRELLLKNDVYDYITWMEAGIDEWRATAFQWRDVAMKAQDQHRLALLKAQTAIGHLQDILNQRCTATQRLEAENAARDWLHSIGSKPA